MRKPSPCLGCTDRYIGCHAKCKQYLAWCSEREKEKAKIWKAKAEEDYFAECAIKRTRRKKR